MMSSFFLNVEPKGQSRARFGNGIAFKSPAQRARDVELRMQIRKADFHAFPDPATPISIRMEFFMPIPQSISAKKRAELAGLPHTKKPDLDNIVKWVLDCLKREKVFHDDSQIAMCTAVKRYQEYGGIMIHIQDADENDLDRRGKNE